MTLAICDGAEGGTGMGNEWSVPDSDGLCFLLTRDGNVLSRCILEWTDTRITLRRINPSGAVAAAFFGRGERRFSLVFPDQRVLSVQVSRCQWVDGERICDIVPLPSRMEASGA
jgi:hypothetical protein